MTSIERNKKKFRSLQLAYNKALLQLAWQFSKKGKVSGFSVEVLAAMMELPPKENIGYKELASERGLSHDCFHFNRDTHSMVSIFWLNTIHV